MQKTEAKIRRMKYAREKIRLSKHTNRLLFCSVFLLTLLFPLVFEAAASDASLPGGKTSKISIQRGAKQLAEFVVETASTKKVIEKGLAKRPSIPDDYGMLFILDKAGEQFFWMEGMEFGLDILFFDKNRRLIEILPNLLPCKECSTFKTPANTAYALEINAGMAYALGIRTGDIFVFAKE